DQSQEMSAHPSEAQEVSGLTKTEAEDLLDCLEAAGYELFQLSYVNGEGFTLRWRFGPKCTPMSKAHEPERHRGLNHELSAIADQASPLPTRHAESGWN